MDIFERLKNIRDYKHLTQDEVAGWFGLTGASYGRKERGKEGGFGPAEIELFLEKTQMSSSYLFGETDSLEEADKTKEKPRNVADELDEIRKVIAQKIPVSKNIDPLSDSLIDQDIRDIVSCVRLLAPEIKRMVLAYCQGLKDRGDIILKKKAG